MKAAERSLLLRVATPALAAAILAVSGAAYAGSGTTASGPAAGKGQVDCKKTPNDPACTPKPR